MRLYKSLNLLNGNLLSAHLLSGFVGEFGFDSNLFVGQVARGVMFPHITINRFCPSPEIPATDVEPFALCATAFNVGVFILEPGH